MNPIMRDRRTAGRVANLPMATSCRAGLRAICGGRTARALIAVGFRFGIAVLVLPRRGPRGVRDGMISSFKRIAADAAARGIIPDPTVITADGICTGA